jgi:hypothetical protein
MGDLQDSPGSPIGEGGQVRTGDFELRVKAPIGEIVIHFSNEDELGQRLGMLGGILETLDKKGKGLASLAQTQVVQEWERIYAVGTDGLPKLKLLPRDKADIVRLGLFLSSRPLTSKEIARVTGVKNPLAYMGARHFVKEVGGAFSLDAEGRREVTNIIIPRLLGASG